MSYFFVFFFTPPAGSPGRFCLLSALLSVLSPLASSFVSVVACSAPARSLSPSDCSPGPGTNRGVDTTAL